MIKLSEFGTKLDITATLFCVGLGSKFYVLCLDSCANICYKKNQNSKIHVTFMINITWNETGICSFGAVWAVRAVGKN